MTSLDMETAQQWDLSEIGLRLLDPDLSLDRFTDLCWTLGRFHEAVRFAIGDALIQGEELYGAEAFQAFEALQLSEDAMMEYRRVSAKVPRARRRKGLSWSHHRAVASLEPHLQEKWLAHARKRSLSHHALREELRHGIAPRVSTVCRCCGRPL